MNNFSRPQFTEEARSNLHQAYLAAIYEVYVEEKTIPLAIAAKNPQLDSLLSRQNSLTWAFITAYNPYSQCLSAAENQKRHESLIQLLQVQNHLFFAGVSRDKDNQWTPETSALILDISIENAIAIGREFQQNAIVWGELNKNARLVWLH